MQPNLVDILETKFKIETEKKPLKESFAKQIPIGIMGASVYSEPSFEETNLIKLAPNTQVQLVNITKQITDGYPWFGVTYIVLGLCVSL